MSVVGKGYMARLLEASVLGMLLIDLEACLIADVSEAITIL